MLRIRNFNYRLILIIYVIFTAGISVGAGIVNLLSPELCEKLVQPFKNASAVNDYAAVFKNSMISHFKAVAFIWVSGFTPAAPYCIIAAVAYKGGILGLFIGAMIKNYGAANGAAYSVCAVLPHNIIYLPVLFWVSAAAYGIWQSRQSRIPPPTGHYFGMFIAVLLLCAAAALTDTYVTSFFIKLIS